MHFKSFHMVSQTQCMYSHGSIYAFFIEYKLKKTFCHPDLVFTRHSVGQEDMDLTYSACITPYILDKQVTIIIKIRILFFKGLMLVIYLTL